MHSEIELSGVLGMEYFGGHCKTWCWERQASTTALETFVAWSICPYNLCLKSALEIWHHKSWPCDEEKPLETAVPPILKKFPFLKEIYHPIF